MKIFYTQLQWGRSNYAAEILSLSPPARNKKESFNGAAAITLRKCGHGILLVWGDVQLQWGRSNYAAEMWPRFPCIRKRENASMGPQQLRCGNNIPAPEHASIEASFNGAAAITLRK